MPFALKSFTFKLRLAKNANMFPLVFLATMLVCEPVSVSTKHKVSPPPLDTKSKFLKLSLKDKLSNLRPFN